MPSIDMSGTKADKSEQEVTSKEMQQSGGGGEGKELIPRCLSQNTISSPEEEVWRPWAVLA